MVYWLICIVIWIICGFLSMDLQQKKGYNSGYCFEKAVYAKYGIEEEWTQDNKASTKGGDICLNGREIQIKYVEKGSLATITSTSKILRQIDKILEIIE